MNKRQKRRDRLNLRNKRANGSKDNSSSNDSNNTDSRKEIDNTMPAPEEKPNTTRLTPVDDDFVREDRNAGSTLPEMPTGRFPALRVELNESLRGAFIRSEEAVRDIKKLAEDEAKMYEEKAEELRKRNKELRAELNRMGV